MSRGWKKREEEEARKKTGKLSLLELFFSTWNCFFSVLCMKEPVVGKRLNFSSYFFMKKKSCNQNLSYGVKKLRKNLMMKNDHFFKKKNIIYFSLKFC